MEEMDLDDQDLRTKFEKRENHFNQPMIQLLEYAFYRGMLTAAGALCPACREEIPFKFLPGGDKLIHLDLLATRESGRGYTCAAEAIIRAMISGMDDNHNPEFSREMMQALMKLLSEEEDDDG